MRNFLRGIRDRLKHLLRPLRRHFYLIEHIYPLKEAARGSGDVENLRILEPARRVEIGPADSDPFVTIGKYYRNGWFDRPDVFVCEFPDAYLYPETGMVCTRHWKVVADLEYRLPHFNEYGARRPRVTGKREGTYATSAYCLAWNYYHWMFDCLPKVISILEAEPTREIIFLMPESTGQVQRESLRLILPPHCPVEYVPTYQWLQVERLIWGSLVSGRGNALLPGKYYDAIRAPIFRQYGLPNVQVQKERLYITRRGSQKRRIVNEEDLLSFLRPYGFRTVELDKLSFREQVELFHRADIVVGPHGAGFNLIAFCGKIQVVVLHPNCVPQNHFHTLARGLGHEYHFVLHPGDDEEAAFAVDLPALKQVLEGEMGLRPAAS